MKCLGILPALVFVALAPTRPELAARPHLRAAADSPSQLIVEPGQGVGPVVRALDHAQRRIFVECYILSNRRIVRAAERAAAQGVEVYVLLERRAIGMGTQPEVVEGELEAAGVSVRWASRRFALTHTKMIVLDDREAIISTANFSQSGFTRDRDFLIFDHNRQVVGRLSALFVDDWDRLPMRTVAPPLLVSPINARRQLEALIQSAKHSISVYAEEIADGRMERKLVSGQKRGVRVRILLEAGQSPAAVDYLEHHGVNVHTLRAPYVHAKLILVDGRVAYLGSENLSTQSLDRNREVGLLLRGPTIQTLGRIFTRDWLRSSAARSPTRRLSGSRTSTDDRHAILPPWPAAATTHAGRRPSASP